MLYRSKTHLSSHVSFRMIITFYHRFLDMLPSPLKKFTKRSDTLFLRRHTYKILYILCGYPRVDFNTKNQVNYKVILRRRLSLFKNNVQSSTFVAIKILVKHINLCNNVNIIRQTTCSVPLKHNISPSSFIFHRINFNFIKQ